MAIQLAPGISFCRVEDEFVFLDLRRDRYFQLAHRDRGTFERLLREEADESDLNSFIAAGILRRGDDDCDGSHPHRHPHGVCAPSEADIARCDILGLEPSRASLAGALETGYHVVRARRGIRKPWLATTIAGLSRRKAVAHPVFDAILATALRFDANRTSIPVPRRCLVDSVALMRMLLARGLAAELVFGVRTRPFAAHCWLQADDHILTCAQDEARNFTPILIL